MTRLDVIKLGLLLLAIVVWFAGMRLGSRPAMLVAIGVVVFAFLLRFAKRPGPPSAPPIR